VDLHTGKQVTSVHRSDGVVSATLSDGGTVTADEVLVALGRRPNTTDLGLESVGIEPGDYVNVDETLRVPEVDGGWLYAVGDVNGRNLLTHMGKYQARAAGDVIAARANGEPDEGPGMVAWADHTVTTQVIFTDPEIGMAGMTQETAERNGLRVRQVEIPLSGVAGASLQADGYTGTARVVIDEDRRVVVGATFVGQDVAELLHSATVAIAGEVPLERLWHAVPPFPTISEIWLRVLEAHGL
jgi:pyruvate/2-oxoglutarate dehydrogenase complex dihydrolipoamide dehydrogenase (E3) component